MEFWLGHFSHQSVYTIEHSMPGMHTSVLVAAIHHTPLIYD